MECEGVVVMMYPLLFGFGGNPPFIDVTDGPNAYTATNDTITEYTRGKVIIARFTKANTTAASLNINGLGVRNIVRDKDTVLTAGEIAAESFHVLVVGDTYFHLESIGTLVQNANKAKTADTATAATNANYAASSGSANTATAATYADYWTNPRTLTLTGDVTGSVSIRGNANMSLTASLATGAAGTVRRIQNGQYSMNSSSVAVSIPITRVNDASKSLPVVYAQTYGNSSQVMYVPVAAFVPATNLSLLTVMLNPASNNAPTENIQGTIAWFVLEYY
jgi:hypothetical protein